MWVAGEWVKLHWYLQLLPVAGITTWAPPPVRLVETLDSQRNANPTVNCACKGSRSHTPYKNLMPDDLRWSWGSDASSGEQLQIYCRETIINQLLAGSYQNPISERQVTIKLHLVAGCKATHLPLSVEKLSSTKLVPGAKKIGDHCFSILFPSFRERANTLALLLFSVVEFPVFHQQGVSHTFWIRFRNPSTSFSLICKNRFGIRVREAATTFSSPQSLAPLPFLI